MTRLARWAAPKVQRVELPASLALLVAALAVFAGVLVRLIDVGEFRIATLLVAADLVVTAAGGLQAAVPDAPLKEAP